MATHKSYRARAAESFRSGVESPLEALGSRALREAQAELEGRVTLDRAALDMLEEALAHEPRDAHERRAAARAYLGVTKSKSAGIVRTKDDGRDDQLDDSDQGALEPLLQEVIRMAGSGVRKEVEDLAFDASIAFDAGDIRATNRALEDIADTIDGTEVDEWLQRAYEAVSPAKKSTGVVRTKSYSYVTFYLDSAQSIGVSVLADQLEEMYDLDKIDVDGTAIHITVDTAYEDPEEIAAWLSDFGSVRRVGDFGPGSKSSSGVRTKAIDQTIEEALSVASSARDLGERAISGGDRVISAAESLMDILNGDLDYNAYQDAESACGDLIDELNGVEVDPDEDFGDDGEEDPVSALQTELADLGRQFGAMSEDEDEDKSAGAVATKGGAKPSKTGMRWAEENEYDLEEIATYIEDAADAQEDRAREEWGPDSDDPDKEMVSMLRNDAKDMRKLATAVRNGRLDDLEDLEPQDTAARDELPSEYYGLRDAWIDFQENGDEDEGD